jgi:hypothetical protein
MPQVMQPYRDQPTQNGPATEQHVKMWYEVNLRLFAALLFDREHRAPNATYVTPHRLNMDASC